MEFLARERSTVGLSGSAYKSLEGDSEFWRLVEGGIVKLERSRRATYGLQAGAYVGQALLSSGVLKVAEKIPGALESLLTLAEFPEATLIDVPSASGKTDKILLSLVDKFLASVNAYLAWGKRREYRTQYDKGCIPRGKVMVAKTISLRARGRGDSLVYSYDALTAVNLINQAIGCGLAVVESILASSGKQQGRLAICRTAALLFEDSDWQFLMRLPPQDIAALTSSVDANGSLLPEERKAYELGRAFAMHFGASVHQIDGTIPVAWFVNLETLFEECLRKALTLAAFEMHLQVEHWTEHSKYVFQSERVLRTRPDYVIPAFAVLDAKYKELGSGVNNPDIYQILAHAEAWSLGNAVLVYAGDKTEICRLGRAQSGVEVWQCIVDVRNLLHSVRLLLQTLQSSSTPETERVAG